MRDFVRGCWARRLVVVVWIFVCFRGGGGRGDIFQEREESCYILVIGACLEYRISRQSHGYYTEPCKL